MSAAPHILFAGGGAAGYFFPGIAVAEHLKRKLPLATITFAGPGRAREKHVVRSAGYEYCMIPSQPVPQNPFQAFRFLTDNIAGYCSARWMLREKGVDLVVGLGGYTSTAVVRAAVAREIPFILLEQNAIPSRTTRWLAEAATLVCAGFEEVRPHLRSQAPVAITGNPARPAFEQLCRRMSSGNRSLEAAKLTFADNGLPSQKRLVILGGADGARSLNESMPRALKKLGETLADWQIIHQTGEGQLQETEGRYRQEGLEALTVTFIDEIASVLFASDLVVCRSGGTTLAELALAGVPAVLVPYPHATDDQQIANAKVFAAANACRLVDESTQTGVLAAALARELTPLVSDDLLRREMSLNIHALSRPEASSDIANAIYETLFESQGARLAA
ncbi:MAG: UDP-N-acetylglucosamine--N-acetylmuramyl-(pentapeptide) pyrophosphoryl-undecaprenol N-acetylglucosamine transferase [Planctomycetales bacterium]|nr:UDP-N-acetylglucosamine--N-acetylmuramyl-(pentapeptide) pyrophosphoryl-undecaprenol N-acetylglucosamine transferase [Planctomycetales bacterium]